MAGNSVINNGVRKLTKFLYIQQSPAASYCCKQRWDIQQITSEQQRSQAKYAVLILNRPISQNKEFMISFWNNASLRMTVDGGTCQWDRFTSTFTEETQQCLRAPELITGDFDSITEGVLDKYKKKGCKAIHTPDQNYTDFTKALMELDKYCQQEKLELTNIVTLGQCSGRLDQILGNIQTLYLAREQKLLTQNSNLYIMSDDSLSWLLPPGEHEIMVPENTRKHERAWCSLVPIGETCQTVNSSGLKWNLENQPLKFGELVSTSNTFDGSDIVKIECSHTILWSMKVPCLIGALQFTILLQTNGEGSSEMEEYCGGGQDPYRVVAPQEVSKKNHRERMRLRHLRDASNPFDLAEAKFRKLFRVPKSSAQYPEEQ